MGVRISPFAHLGDLRAFRADWGGTLMLASGFDPESAKTTLDAGEVDLAVFGRPFIANPDLVARLKSGWPAGPSRARGLLRRRS